MRLLVFLTSSLIALCGAELQKDFSVARDVMKVAKEVKEAAEVEARRIMLACDGTIATQIQAETSVKEWSTEL